MKKISFFLVFLFIMIFITACSNSNNSTTNIQNRFLGLDDEIHFGMTKKDVLDYANINGYVCNDSVSLVKEVFWDGRFRGTLCPGFDDMGELDFVSMCIHNIDLEHGSAKAITDKVLETYGNPNEYEVLPVEFVISESKWYLDGQTLLCKVYKYDDANSTKVELTWKREDVSPSDNIIDLSETGIKVFLEDHIAIFYCSSINSSYSSNYICSIYI